MSVTDQRLAQLCKAMDHDRETVLDIAVCLRELEQSRRAVFLLRHLFESFIDAEPSEPWYSCVDKSLMDRVKEFLYEQSSPPVLG